VLFIVSLVMSMLLFLVLMMKVIFLSERDDAQFKRMGVALLGYPFGSIHAYFKKVLLASLCFREATSIMSRGILLATDLIIRNDRYLTKIE
jgi:hypothetical protein